MIKIRQNVFETNSSSTHSVVLCDEKTWCRFVEGELYYNTLSRYHKEYLEEYPLDTYQWVPEDSGLNDLPLFCTFKEIKDYLGTRSYRIIIDALQDRTEYEKNVDNLHRLAHTLLFASETFYSFKELEGYEYDTTNETATLNYYFG